MQTDFLFRRSLWLAVFIAWKCIAADSVSAQLTLLSKGNTAAKWRETQLEALQQQLDAPDLSAELKAELESQRKWLTAWKPGELSRRPLWDAADIPQALVEPIIDPNHITSDLRERLLGATARPTIKDTQELKRLLTQHRKDIGVRQLHLHWLDQIQYRKTYAQEIANTAQRLIGLFEQLPPSPEVSQALIFCLYRQGRGLAYRELPDVIAEKPIEDLEKHDAELLGTYRRLKELSPNYHAEFVLLDVRMLRRDHWNGQALVLLEDFGASIEQQWLLKKRRDILTDLGWTDAAREAASVYAEAYPQAEPEQKN